MRDEMDNDEERRRAAWTAAAAAYGSAAEPLTAQAGGAILAASALGPRSEFLDLGCGTGALSLAAQNLGALATGVDLSPAMIAAAEARPGGRQAAFRIGDMRALDARAGGYEAAAANFSIVESGAPEQALKEIHRALQDGGRLAWTHWPGGGGGRLFEMVEAALLSVAGAEAKAPAARGLEAEEAAALTGALGFQRVESLRLSLRAPRSAEAMLAAAEALDPSGVRVAGPARRAALAALEETLQGEADAPFLETPAILILAQKGDGAATPPDPVGDGKKVRGGLLGVVGRWLRKE